MRAVFEFVSWWYRVIIPAKLPPYSPASFQRVNLNKIVQSKHQDRVTLPVYDSSGLPLNDGPAVSDRWVKHG